MAAGNALQIRATEPADATCIAQALRQFEARVERADEEWTVVVPAVGSRAITTAVLDALKTCLESSDIAS